MNTREFLSLVVPDAGIKYLAELKVFEAVEHGKVKKIPFFKHYPYDDVAGMAGAATELDTEGKAIYFALAGFADPTPSIDRRTGQPKVNGNGQPKLDRRTQKLAVSVKALWADIDCSPEKAEKGAGYANKKEALGAVVEFCKATKTPPPLIVDSGGGLHCYWPFEKEIKADQWVQLAKLWRAVVQHFGLRSDPARDVDVASVLRPVGTYNRKTSPARLVRALNPDKVIKWGAGKWVQHIAGLMKANRIAPLPAVAPKAFAPSINDDLGVEVEYPPSSAVEATKHCSQLLNFYNARGDVSEPLWRAALGVLKHAVDGEALAHEWSSGHPDYSYEDTQEKLDRWAAGPTTCEYFRGCNPAGCDGCKFEGKVKSPIQLGVKAPEEPVVVPVTQPGSGVTTEFVLPEGYTVSDRMLCRFVQDAEGVTHQVPLLSNAFYVLGRVYDAQTGTYSNHCVTQKPDGRLRRFVLPASAVGSSKLAETLSSYEVFLMSNKALEHVRDYARRGIARLAETGQELRTVTKFGWNHDCTEFVFGDQVFYRDGTAGPVAPTGNALSKVEALTDRAGSAAGWAKAVDMVYNRPKMEVMQYAICSAFGSLLAPLVGSNTFTGALLALTSPTSGLGKTTVAQFAMYAFGNVRGLTITGRDGATANALFAEMATMNNIPLLLDEFSDADREFVSSLAYAVVNGHERKRLSSSGDLREQRTWAMSPFITSNVHLGRLLSGDGTNAEAQAVRIMEFSLDTLGVPHLPAEEMRAAEELVRANRGMAGLEYIQHIVANRDVAKAKVLGWYDKILKTSPTLSESKYRFFRGHLAATMAAAEILQGLGRINFHLGDLYDWAVRSLERLIDDIVNTNVSGAEDALGRMLNAYSQQIIVTYGFGDARGVREAPLVPVRGEPVGRHILGSTKVPMEWHNVLALTKTAAKQWCTKHRADYTAILREGEALGIIVNPDLLGGDRVVLGKGTDIPCGQTRCLFIDMARIQGMPKLRIVPPGAAAEDLVAKG